MTRTFALAFGLGLLAALVALAAPAALHGAPGGTSGRSGRPFGFGISASGEPGYATVVKFGRNADVDAASAEDVWATGGTRTYLAAAETMDVVSDSANDDGDPVGTGARTFRVEGLDGSGASVTEDVTLNGVTTVTTSQTYSIVFRAFVLTAGTVGSNDGTITITPTTTSAATQATIAPGDGQTLVGHYTIPAGKTGYLVSASGGLEASGSGVGGNLQLFKRELNGAWRIQWESGGRSDGGFPFGVDFYTPLSFPAQTDLRWVADVDSNNSTAVISYTVVLVDD